MYIANTRDGSRISVENADSNETYYCPICNGELYQRRGSIRVPHFAHKSNEDCDTWTSDMSEWHVAWQQRFPEECREVVIVNGSEKHRADILIKNTVVEFQHSKMSNKEFWERNRFYTAAGYKLVWLFDLSEVRQGNLERTDSQGVREYRWKYPWHVFDSFEPTQNPDIYLNVQFLMEEPGGGSIEQIMTRSINSNVFTTRYGAVCNDNEFVSLLTNQSIVDTFRVTGFTIADIQDTLIEARDDDNYWVCGPCPLKDGASIAFETCDACAYSIQCFHNESIGKPYAPLYQNRDSLVRAEHVTGCLFRFKDILNNWNMLTDRVLSVEYNNCGVVKDFSVQKTGEIIKMQCSTHTSLSPASKSFRNARTIPDILRYSKMTVVGLRNIVTGTRVKVKNNEIFKNKYVRVVYGYLGNDYKNTYWPNSTQIFRANRAEWVVEWSH